MDGFSKSIFLVTTFFILIFLLTPQISTHYDYIFHFEKSKNVDACPWPYLKIHCDNYPSLMHLIANPFTYSEVTYFYFLLLLNLVLIPVLLFHYTRRFETVLFFFSSYAWTEGAVLGTLAQTGAMIFFIVFLFERDWWKRVLLLFAGIFVHKLLLFLLLGYWLLESFEHYLNRTHFLLALPSFPKIGFDGFAGAGLTFFRQTNLLAFFLAVKQIFLEKRWSFLFLGFACFIGAVSGIDRFFWVIHVLIAIEAGKRNLRLSWLLYTLFFVVYVIIKIFFAVGLLSKVFTGLMIVSGLFIIFYYGGSKINGFLAQDSFKGKIK